MPSSKKATPYPVMSGEATRGTERPASIPPSQNNKIRKAWRSNLAVQGLPSKSEILDLVLSTANMEDSPLT